MTVYYRSKKHNTHYYFDAISIWVDTANGERKNEEIVTVNIKSKDRDSGTIKIGFVLNMTTIHALVTGNALHMLNPDRTPKNFIDLSLYRDYETYFVWELNKNEGKDS